MMRVMKGGNQTKLMRQLEAMKGKGGVPWNVSKPDSGTEVA
jgi:hypothetical protein